MNSGIRGSLKSFIPKRFWPFLRFVDKYLISCLYIFLALKRFVFRFIIKRHTLEPQSIPCIHSDINFGSYPGGDLEEIVSRSKMNYKSGRHSVYIDCEADIHAISATLQARYPHPIGLKLIKSLELSSDNTPYYTSHTLAPASTWFSMYAVGSMREQAIVSNLLHERNVAPRVYDIIRLESENGNWCYAYVVQPINGPVVIGVTGEKFITHFKEVLADLGMETISIKEHCDLRPPDFRHNIRFDKKKMYYVDIQNFVLASNKFANNILQNISKRETGDLPDTDNNLNECAKPLTAFLSKCGLDIHSLNVVDYELPGEELTLSFLAEGGGWCELIKPEGTVQLVKQYMLYHGFSRFDVHASGVQDAILREIFLKERPCVLMVYEKNIENMLSGIDFTSPFYLLLVHSNSEFILEKCNRNLFGNLVETGTVITANKKTSHVSLLKICK